MYRKNASTGVLEGLKDYRWAAYCARLLKLILFQIIIGMPAPLLLDSAMAIIERQKSTPHAEHCAGRDDIDDMAYVEYHAL